MSGSDEQMERRTFVKTGVLATAGAAALGSGVAHGLPEGMTTADRMIIEYDCAKLINRFHHLINADLSSVARDDLFTKNAELDFGWFKVGPGPDAMRAPLADRAAKMRDEGWVVMNAASNAVIEVIDGDHARGVSVDTEWRHVSGDAMVSLPAPVPLPTYIGYWTDEFRREDGQWKFAHREIQYTFDEQRWSGATSADYPEGLILSHEEWRKQIGVETQ